MSFPKRKISFVLASTAHGPIIISRLDFEPGDRNGNAILEGGSYEPFQMSCVLDLLEIRRQHYGHGVVAIDCGANVGIHTVEWSKLMTDWGWVLSIEAQERLYYALAGNVALNNCFNVQAIRAAVGGADGVINIPKLDFFQPARYGSLEFKQRPATEFIGQKVSYDQADLVQVQALRLDSLKLNRVDFIKIDVEGMEVETLHGAHQLLSTHKPFLVIEIIKSDQAKLAEFLHSLGYNIYRLGQIDVLAVHRSDKALAVIEARDWTKEAQ